MTLLCICMYVVVHVDNLCRLNKVDYNDIKLDDTIVYYIRIVISHSFTEYVQ